MIEITRTIEGFDAAWSQMFHYPLLWNFINKIPSHMLKQEIAQFT